MTKLFDAEFYDRSGYVIGRIENIEACCAQNAKYQIAKQINNPFDELVCVEANGQRIELDKSICDGYTIVEKEADSKAHTARYGVRFVNYSGETITEVATTSKPTAEFKNILKKELDSDYMGLLSIKINQTVVTIDKAEWAGFHIREYGKSTS